MAKKWERRLPSFAQGWADETLQEDIDDAVEHTLNTDGPREYHRAYQAAQQHLKDGKQPDEVRQLVQREPFQQPYSVGDSAEASKHKTIYNRVQQELVTIRRDAIEDAIAGKPPRKP